MVAFNDTYENKEQVQELTPEQKVKRVLEAISKYVEENREELQNDKEKAQRIRDLAFEAEQLEKGDINEAQVYKLKKNAEAEGIQVDLETPAENEDAPKTKKFNKKMAAYIVAALVALGTLGWAYYYSTSDKKDDGKGKTKTEKIEEKKGSKASENKRVTEAESIIKQAKEEWEKLDKLMK